MRGVNSVCAHVVADHFTLSVATVVMAFMSTHAEDVEFNTCWKSETVVAFFFNMEADEGNTFFMLATHHFHDFAEFFHADVAILVFVVHCEHHFTHVVKPFLVRSFSFTMVFFLFHHDVRHF